MQSLGVDIGGTHLRAVWVDADTKVLTSCRRSLDAHTPAAVLRQLAQALEELKAPPSLPLGVALAALLRPRDGMVVNAPNLNWRDVAFADLLRTVWRGPLRLMNDLDAITYGEFQSGAARGEDNFLSIFLGTGLGMGAVCQGQLVEGSEGLATEIGHIKVASVMDGRLCGCGQRGCVEAYVSGKHFPELINEKMAAGRVSTLSASRQSAAEIENAAQQGDDIAIAVWNEAAEYLAQAVGTAITLFNPRLVVFGGGVFTAAPSLLRKAQKRLPFYCPLAHQSDLTFAAARLGDEAGAIGAALLAAKK